MPKPTIDDRCASTNNSIDLAMKFFDREIKVEPNINPLDDIHISSVIVKVEQSEQDVVDNILAEQKYPLQAIMVQ